MGTNTALCVTLCDIVLPVKLTYLRDVPLEPCRSRARTACGTSPAANTVPRFFQLLRSCEVYRLILSDTQSQVSPYDTLRCWPAPYLHTGRHVCKQHWFVYLLL